MAAKVARENKQFLYLRFSRHWSLQLPGKHIANSGYFEFVLFIIFFQSGT